jgi:hypothetical protein
MGEAEEDEHEAAAEILIGYGLSVLIGQGERAADQRFARGRDRRPELLPVSANTAAPAMAPIRNPARTTMRMRPRIYSPNCSSEPLTLALARNRLNTT